MFSAFRERAFICYILFFSISVKSFFVNSSTDISPSSPSLLERTETVPDSSSLSSDNAHIIYAGVSRFSKLVADLFVSTSASLGALPLQAFFKFVCIACKLFCDCHQSYLYRRQPEREFYLRSAL